MLSITGQKSIQRAEKIDFCGHTCLAQVSTTSFITNLGDSQDLASSHVRSRTSPRDFLYCVMEELMPNSTEAAFSVPCFHIRHFSPALSSVLHGKHRQHFPCVVEGLWHQTKALLLRIRIWLTNQSRNVCYSMDFFIHIMKSLLCLKFFTCNILVSTWKKYSVKSKQDCSKSSSRFFIIYEEQVEVHTK